jgi:protoheme IX farnesyltransferase
LNFILPAVPFKQLNQLLFVCLLLGINRWAAAAGEVSMGGWLLASVLYFWQIPHFMAIAYLCREDYAAGGYAPCILIILMHLSISRLNLRFYFSFKMLSTEDASGRRTALAALRNCGYLVPLGYLAHQSMCSN